MPNLCMHIDTPTICNAIELVAPERRGHGFTTHSMVVARPELKPMVGYARTATYRSAAPSDRPAADLGAQRAAKGVQRIRPVQRDNGNRAVALNLDNVLGHDAVSF